MVRLHNVLNNVRITLYFYMFELRTEIMLQLRFLFDLHCNVFLLRHNFAIYLFNINMFLITLELRYILVRLSYIWK